MKHLYFFGLLFSLPFLGFSQGEWNNWYFGEWAGVSFNSGIPQYLMDSKMSALRSAATVSDSLGNLLFYTDGLSVYDRTNSIMPNGTGLLSATQDQSVCVVQNISDHNLYYIFTINCRDCWPPPLPDGGLHYSVVDMRLNGGLGDIVTGQKNIILLGNANYPVSMTAARHHNNKDAWLIIRNTLADTNFYAYLITSGGIQEPPVVSSSTLYDPSIDNPGYMRVSPDGTKLISPYNDLLEYCQFNSLTGQITPLFYIEGKNTGNDDGWAYLEFSIDSRYLYRSSADWRNAKIYQYDATLEDSVLFKHSETYVGHTLHGVHLQMGPDWKIYGDESTIDSMCVINNPTIGGIGCNFQANAVYLNQRKCLQGLPQFLQKYYAYINHSTIQCSPTLVNFTSSVWPPADSIHWDFGDPSSGAANYSNLPNPAHIYTNAGTYTVELFVRHIDNRTDTSWQTITIMASPSVTNNPLSKTICSGESTNIPLTSNVPGTMFNWTATLTTGNITGYSADSGLVINQILISSLSTPGIVTYHITPKIGSCVGTTVNFPVTVNSGDSVKVNITASANNICAGDPVILTAIPSNGGTLPVYQWLVNSSGAGADTSVFTYVPGNGDQVICILTSDLQCVINNVASDTLLINVIDPHKVTDTTLCYGIPYFAQGAWQTTGGTYHDTLANPVSCIRFIETHLSYKPAIPVDLGNDTILCGNMITLSVHVPGGTYVWQDGSKDSIYVVTLPGEYSVLVGYDGCVNSDSINIGECPVLIWFPNAFTPNSDGLNDTFHPIGIGIEKFSMQIFNRWGTMVFETSSPENGWDGTYKGSLCPEETYVFKASYEISGEIKQVNGTITLLH